MVGRVRSIIACVAAGAVLLTGCATSAAEAREKIKEKIDNISVEQVLEDLRDCDKLSDAFVGLVRTGADTVDQLAETTEGRVPETEIREVVDRVAANQFFAIAEKIGCNKLQSKLEVVDQLRGVNPTSPEGDDFLNEILREIEASA